MDKIEIWLFQDVCLELRINDRVVEFIKAAEQKSKLQELLDDYGLIITDWDTDLGSLIDIIVCERRDV